MKSNVEKPTVAPHVTEPSRPSWRPERRAVALVVLALAGACKASVQADAKVSGEAASSEPVQEFDRPLDAASLEAAKTKEADLEGGGADYALLGARHDLDYDGPKTPTCQCLAVSLRDRADDAAFKWELGAPRVNPATQWVIALSSEGVPCDSAPSGTLGASYQGYVVEGNDVVVFVEALGEGRPMTNGAVIPRPAPGGAVLIEAAGAVYGRPLDGKSKRCRLEAPAGSGNAASAAPPPAASGAKPADAKK